MTDEDERPVSLHDTDTKQLNTVPTPASGPKEIDVHEVSDPFAKDAPNPEELTFTEPEGPTYVAGNQFVDQAPRLGATTLIDLSQVQQELDALEATGEEEEISDFDEANAASRMLRGSMWMTIGSLASRFLGAIYIIPWVAMIGNVYFNQANSLYAQGYQIYGVALMVATAGLPNVVARLVAEYSAKKEFTTVKQVLRQSLLLGGAMGFAAAAFLYLFAGLLSQGDPNVVLVIRSLSAAVLVIPILAMLRGFLQGYEMMGPSALSQFIEQVVRVIYMLALTYWIMVVNQGSWVDATVQSTFAAFWGALAGIAVLIYCIFRHRDFFKRQEEQSTQVEDVDTRQLMLRMARQSVPVILGGSAIALVQLIDQYTFFNIMRTFTSFGAEAVQNMYAQFAFNSNKLVMLTISLAVGLAETALPLLARARETGDREVISDRITYAMKLLSFVMVPAALGMAVIAQPLYLLFYNTNDLHNGTLILQYASITSIVLGLYMVVLALYQGLGRLRETVLLLGIIIFAKLALQVPLTLWFAGMGPLMSTAIAFAIGIYLALRRLSRDYEIDWEPFNKSLVIILFWSLIMFAVTLPLSMMLSGVLGTGKLMQLIIIIIVGGVGAAIYGIAALKTPLAVDVLGPRAERLAKKLPF
jgi:O-antigen/teichoic acid export membrane protein